MLPKTILGMCDVGKQGSYEVAEHHFSSARLHHYLVAAGGDRDLAHALYVWNSQLAAALFADLGHLEVAVRNALDERMTMRHQSAGHPGSWLDDPTGALGRDLINARPRHRQPYRDIDRARRRVHDNGKPLDHGQIISETSLGLWHQLVSKRFASSLWPDLARAFPHAPSRNRALVADRLEALRDLRNRIGHHHRIWNLPCEGLQVQLQELAGYIDPDLATWIEASSSLSSTLARSPLAAL